MPLTMKANTQTIIISVNLAFGSSPFTPSYINNAPAIYVNVHMGQKWDATIKLSTSNKIAHISALSPIINNGLLSISISISTPISFLFIIFF